MDNKTSGAWIIHHSEKLASTTSQDFDAIGFAGKCGTLLSAISGSGQTQLNKIQLDSIAKANGVSPKTELPSVISELERQKLILRGQTGVEVLGLTGHMVLEHTATIFAESEKESFEDAVIFLSEAASELPITYKQAIEQISDNFQLISEKAADAIDLGSLIGFFDAEEISSGDKLLFNGNLFRRESADKVNAVLGSLKTSDENLLREVNQKLHAAGCLPLDSVVAILGQALFDKLHSIAMFDVSVVGNDKGKSCFVTRPSAFCKFTKSIADDALDLAKALVASLTYGMTISSQGRGRIQMVSVLMNKLIAGHPVGPATAIGNDYQALEYKGVVRVTPAANGMFTMRLLKPDVGRLALAVIEDGDITAEAVTQIPGARVTEYLSPEHNREVKRRDSSPAVKLSASNLLNEIRTGGLSV